MNLAPGHGPIVMGDPIPPLPTVVDILDHRRAQGLVPFSLSLLRARRLALGKLGSASHGIHWHVDRGVKIRYLSDASRQKIYDIEMTMPDGSCTTPAPLSRAP